MRKFILKQKIRFYRNRMRKYSGQYLYNDDTTKVTDLAKAMHWKKKVEEAKTEWYAKYAKSRFGVDVTGEDFNPKQHSELLDDPPGTEPDVVAIVAEDWDEPVPNKTVTGEEVLVVPDPPDLNVR